MSNHPSRRGLLGALFAAVAGLLPRTSPAPAQAQVPAKTPPTPPLRTRPVGRCLTMREGDGVVPWTQYDAAGNVVAWLSYDSFPSPETLGLPRRPEKPNGGAIC